MANIIVNNFLGLVLSGDIDLNSDVLKMSLHGSSFNGDDEDDNMGNVTTLGELSGTGYTAGHGNSGRKTISNPTITVDDPNDQAEFDCDDPVWTGIDAGTAEMACLHRQGTSDDSDAKRIGDYDISQVTNGGNLTLQVNAEGLLKLTRAAGS
jgi:hypothetical protein